MNSLKRGCLLTLLGFWGLWDPMFVGAESIYLKNGLKITGTIVEQKEKYTKVNVSGVDVTYYADEIDHIEGAKTEPAKIISPGTVSPVAPAAPQDKEKLIMEFMEVSGTRQAMQELLEEIGTQVPPEQAAKLRQSINLNQLLSRLVPVYNKYFTEEEIAALISFQKSPVGKKLVKVTPQLMQDSVQAALGYINEVVPELRSKK